MIKIKQVVLLSLLLLFSQLSFSQTKIDEYNKTGSDSESAHMDNLAVALTEQPESRVLINIYSGKNNENIGNIFPHIRGIKSYLSIVRKIKPKRIFFSVKEGKEKLFKELWIYPKDTPLPELSSVKLDLTNLKTKFLYGTHCGDCHPAVIGLSTAYISFKLYAELLKEYPNHKALIIIHPDSLQGWSRKVARENALNYVIDYRKTLMREYKINAQRISIRIAEPVGEDSPVILDFYIAPDGWKQ